MYAIIVIKEAGYITMVRRGPFFRYTFRWFLNFTDHIL
jgi:hypothetical protein